MTEFIAQQTNTPKETRHPKKPYLADGDGAQKGKGGYGQLEQEEEEEQDAKAVVQEEGQLEDGPKCNNQQGQDQPHSHLHKRQTSTQSRKTKIAEAGNAANAECKRATGQLQV